MIGFILAIILFYFLFDPLTSRFMPQCIFHRITGWQCVGCGSQRMAHALLHGDLAGAFRANAFATVSLPFIAFLVWVETQRVKRPALYRKVYSTSLTIVVCVLFVVWFVVRNILGI